MNKSTVRPGLTRKRAKRTVENTEYVAFTRRILRGYARRVAAGDVEALRSMTALRADIDDATREAVRGLRVFGYSWSEIASRLGVTRQSAQMRWGDPADRGTLDKRITTAGMTVTVPTLVAVLVEHWPDSPADSTCPGCGYRYPTDSFGCPTLATVRPMLYRRRYEDQRALSRLTYDQDAYLKQGKTPRTGGIRRPVPPSRLDRDIPSLLDLVAGGDAP